MTTNTKPALTRSQLVQRIKPSAPMAAPAIAVNGVYIPMARSTPIPPQIAVTQKLDGPCHKADPWKARTPANDSLMRSKAAPG